MITRVKDEGFGLLTELSAPPDSSGTIVVAGAPRSGTTWLSELLRSLDGYKFLNEPLHLEWFPEARQAGFGWRTHIAPSEKASWARDYISSALTGRLSRRRGWRFEAETLLGKIWEHAANQKIIVKFCRGHRLLHWIDSHFDVRGIVFIIRHPCAVLASMLRHGAWEDLDPQKYDDPRDLAAIHALPDEIQKSVLERLPPLETRHEALMATWCVDHYVALHAHADDAYPWVFTTYETLLVDGGQEIERICNALGKEAPEGIRRMREDPSSSVSSTFSSNVEQQLSKWKNHLPKKTIGRILKMVDSFGIDIYGKKVTPTL